MPDWPDSDEELCILGDERFFVRAQPDVWVEISEDDFKRLADVWEIEGREAEGPVPGVLESGEAVRVRLRPVGEAPVVDAG
jgi:hypothetical protein